MKMKYYRKSAKALYKFSVSLFTPEFLFRGSVGYDRAWQTQPKNSATFEQKMFPCEIHLTRESSKPANPRVIRLIFPLCLSDTVVFLVTDSFISQTPSCR